MPKVLHLSDGEFDALCKVLRQNPPGRLPEDWDGGEIYYYQRLLTHVLRENFMFPDTDDGES